MAARAVITHQWSDGGAIRLVVACDSEHPDALDMITAGVLALYREAVPAEAD